MNQGVFPEEGKKTLTRVDGGFDPFPHSNNRGNNTLVYVETLFIKKRKFFFQLYHVKRRMSRKENTEEPQTLFKIRT
jgi:hypothetical protein